jgi:PAS domain S-box-containing protein
VRPGIDGAEGLWHVFIRDLTESERLGEELGRAAEEMTRRARARDDARTKLRGTARELERATRRIDDLTAELDELKGTLAASRRDLAATASARDNARAESERGARETDRLRADLARTQAAAGTLGQELDRSRTEHARLADELDRVRAEHADATSALSRGADELDQTRADRAQLADELDRVAAEHARVAEELQRALRGRDEADAALAAAEAEGRLVAKYGSELIARYDERGVCMAVSAGARGLLGYEPDELVGRPGAELIHPEDRARLLRARAGQSETTFRARLRNRAGEYVPVEVSFRPDEGSGGRLGEVTTVARPIAERRADDDATRVAETRFRSLFGTLPYASALIGQDGRIRRANPAFARLVGYSGDQLEGTTLDTLVADGEGALLASRLRQVSTGHVATLRLEQRIAHASGRVVPVELRITPLPADGDARLHELVVHFEDVSGEMRLTSAVA